MTKIMPAAPSTRSSISAAGQRLTDVKSKNNRFREVNSAAAAGQRPISKQSSRGDDNTNTDPGRKHKHKKKKSQKPAEEEEAERETDSDSPPPAKPGRSHPAWSMFSDHVKIVSRSDLFLGEKKESYNAMCSVDHHKTLTEIKEINMKKHAKSMFTKISAIQRIKASHILSNVEDNSQGDKGDNSSDEESEAESSEDEEEIAERERRRATARQHWECIRRYVQDRIKQRRNKKMGFNQDKAFKRLRAQAKASLNPEQARRQLYEKYGIVPKAGRLYPEDVMKPVHSTKAQEIIQKFEQIQILSIHSRGGHRPRTSYLAGGDNDKIDVKTRPRTMNHHGTNYANRKFR